MTHPMHHSPSWTEIVRYLREGVTSRFGMATADWITAVIDGHRFPGDGCQLCQGELGDCSAVWQVEELLLAFVLDRLGV